MDIDLYQLIQQVAEMARQAAIDKSASDCTTSQAALSIAACRAISATCWMS